MDVKCAGRYPARSAAEVRAGRQPARERSAADIDWGALMPEVAQILFGDPPRKSGGQWRYGRKGSLAVHVSGSRAGQWYSFEDDEGGGVLALIEFRAGLSPDANHRAAFDWLRERGLIPAEPPPKPSAQQIQTRRHSRLRKLRTIAVQLRPTKRTARAEFVRPACGPPHVQQMREPSRTRTWSVA